MLCQYVAGSMSKRTPTGARSNPSAKARPYYLFDFRGEKSGGGGGRGNSCFEKQFLQRIVCSATLHPKIKYKEVQCSIVYIYNCEHSLHFSENLIFQPSKADLDCHAL